MKRIMRLAPLCLICSLIICMFADTAALASPVVQFKLMRHQFIVVPVSVNGLGPFDFLLDTGTNTTIISPELARRLRLRPIDRTALVTVAGTQVVARSRIERLSLGSQSVADLEVLCAELREVRALSAQISGVLGQNFLSQFSFLVNFRERRIAFEERGEEESQLSGQRLPFEWDEGRLVISAQALSPSRRSLRLVLDSAAPGLILFRPEGFSFSPSEPGWLRAATDVGSRWAARGRLDLQIGSEEFFDLPAALLTGPATSEGRSEDGLLPISLFRSIYVNTQKCYVILNPRPGP